VEYVFVLGVALCNNFNTSRYPGMTAQISKWQPRRYLISECLMIDLHLRFLALKHGFRIHMVDISPLYSSNLVVLYIYCFQGTVTHRYSGDIHSFNNSTLI
jgi:hypothetical protein